MIGLPVTNDQQSDQHGHAETDGRRDLRGPHAVEDQRQQGAEDAAAVAGEGRQQVEQHQEDVGRHQQEGELGGHDAQTVADVEYDGADVGEERVGENDHRQQQAGNDEIDRRPGDGYEHFLDRTFRHPFETGDAADRIKGDVARRNAEGPCGQGVAEFVQQHAAEHHADQGGHEQGVEPAVAGLAEQDEGRQQQKRRMEIKGDAERGPQSPGTKHESPGFHG